MDGTGRVTGIAMGRDYYNVLLNGGVTGSLASPMLSSSEATGPATTERVDDPGYRAYVLAEHLEGRREQLVWR